MEEESEEEEEEEEEEGDRKKLKVEEVEVKYWKNQMVFACVGYFFMFLTLALIYLTQMPCLFAGVHLTLRLCCGANRES